MIRLADVSGDYELLGSDLLNGSDDTQRQLVEALHLLAAYELGDPFSGQIILRSSDQTYAVSPMGRPWNCVNPDEVILASRSAIESRRAGVINYPAAVNSLGMLQRSGINAVVHVHPPAATVLGSLGLQVEPFSQEGCLFFENQVVIADRFDFDLGRPVWLHDSVGTHRVLAIRNHGIMVQGARLSEAMAYALQYEACAEQQLELLKVGHPYSLIPPAAARALRDANGSLFAVDTWYKARVEAVIGAA